MGYLSLKDTFELLGIPYEPLSIEELSKLTPEEMIKRVKEKSWYYEPTTGQVLHFDNSGLDENGFLTVNFDI